MTPALIAAVKVCIAVMQPVTYSTAYTGQPIEWVYPPGFEKCPALIAKRDREEAAEIASHHDNALKYQREIYRRGVQELEKGK